MPFYPVSGFQFQVSFI